MRPRPLPLTASTLALVAAVAGACDAPVETAVAPPELLEMGADLVNYDMVTFLTASGVREGRVRGDTAFVFSDSAKVVIRGMEVVFYDDNGRPRATVRSLGGEMDTNTDRMVARGDVVLEVHADGRRIESAELHYDPDRDRIWSDSATVQTDAEGRVTRGSAFESNLEFTDVRIDNIRGGSQIGR